MELSSLWIKQYWRLSEVWAINILTNKVSVKLSDGKIKEFPSGDVEMIDTEVNIEIDTENSPSYSYASMQTEEIIDIKQYEDDKNSSSGEV